ncbi:DMT family transporter [Promicromonospora sp. MEB111]|uniref:DMT family transporter n=1 Tax=unclassified Promicromonospora TaxID=2647929 RepID=UPI00254DE7E4|nr:DMT family transporter [Promicromonospora sp. MEB111]
MQAIAVALAVLGAALFAGAAVLQHREVADLYGQPFPRERVLSLRRLSRIVRRPGWLAGFGLAAGGTIVHAVALALAPLRLVQPIGVLAVPVAVLLSSLLLRRVPGRNVLLGVALTMAGVAVFVAASVSATSGNVPPPGSTLPTVLVVGGVVVGLGIAGLAAGGWLRCVACATAGATAFGLLSALMRVIFQELAVGTPWHDPQVLGTAAAAIAALVLGGWLVQQAYPSGPPEVVVACLTVVDPIVAVLLGAVLLGEGADTPVATWFLLGGAALAAAAGVLVLARLHPDAVAARAARTTPSRLPEPSRGTAQ